MNLFYLQLLVFPYNIILSSYSFVRCFCVRHRFYYGNFIWNCYLHFPAGATLLFSFQSIAPCCYQSVTNHVYYVHGPLSSETHLAVSIYFTWMPNRYISRQQSCLQSSTELPSGNFICRSYIYMERNRYILYLYNLLLKYTNLCWLFNLKDVIIGEILEPLHKELELCLGQVILIILWYLIT